MSVPEVFKEMVLTAGKKATNALFPNEFEYYSLGLELTNSRGETEEYFMFPVMPQQIQYTQGHQNNTLPTSKGVYSTTNPNFIPGQLSIKGDFGVKFKTLVGRTMVDARAIRFSTQSGSFPTLKTSNLSLMVKRGYGAIKILEAICEKSDKLDNDKKPYSLYVYNTALSQSFLCKVKGFSLSQGMEKNRVWGYDLTLETLAPLTAKSRQLESISQIGMGVINQGANSLVNQIRKTFF